jgi:hypothetical protein
MNQKNPAPSGINLRKSLLFIILITIAIVLVLKVIKETTTPHQPLPLMSPLPDSSTLQDSNEPKPDE